MEAQGGQGVGTGESCKGCKVWKGYGESSVKDYRKIVCYKGQ